MTESMEIIISTILVCIAVFTLILGFIGIKGMKRQRRLRTAARVSVSNALYKVYGISASKKSVDKFLKHLK